MSKAEYTITQRLANYKAMCHPNHQKNRTPKQRKIMLQMLAAAKRSPKYIIPAKKHEAFLRALRAAA